MDSIGSGLSSLFNLGSDSSTATSTGASALSDMTGGYGTLAGQFASGTGSTGNTYGDLMDQFGAQTSNALTNSLDISALQESLKKLLNQGSSSGDYSDAIKALSKLGGGTGTGTGNTMTSSGIPLSPTTTGLQQQQRSTGKGVSLPSIDPTSITKALTILNSRMSGK